MKPRNSARYIGRGTRPRPRVAAIPIFLFFQNHVLQSAHSTHLYTCRACSTEFLNIPADRLMLGSSVLLAPSRLRALNSSAAQQLPQFLPRDRSLPHNSPTDTVPASPRIQPDAHHTSTAGRDVSLSLSPQASIAAAATAHLRSSRGRHDSAPVATNNHTPASESNPRRSHAIHAIDACMEKGERGVSAPAHVHASGTVGPEVPMVTPDVILQVRFESFFVAGSRLVSSAALEWTSQLDRAARALCNVLDF
jgi:hypothetical protein